MMNHIGIGLVPLGIMSPRIEQINQYLAEQRQAAELTLKEREQAIRDR